MKEELDDVTSTIYYNLTTRQLRALASQRGIIEWNTASAGELRRTLGELAKTVNILDGEQA